MKEAFSSLFKGLVDNSKEKFFHFLEKYNPCGPAERRKSFLNKPETFLFILFALLTFIMVLFHEPWRDEAQGYLIVRELSVSQLIMQLKNEVHFPVWYLFIFPFVKLGGTLFAVNILHWLLACTIAYLILEKFPFRLLTRTALIFSFPLFFEFCVVARNYTIGFLLLTIILLFWKDLWKNTYLMAVLLALTLLTDIFFGGFVLGLCICIFIQAFQQKKLKEKRFLLSVCIVFFAVLASFFLLFHFSAGESFLPHAADNALKGDLFTWKHCIIKPLELICGFLGMKSIFTIFLFLLICWKLHKSTEGLILWLVNTFFIYCAFAIGGFDSIRHLSFFLAGAVVAFTLLLLQEKEEKIRKKKTSFPGKILNIVLFLLLFFCGIRQVEKSAMALWKEVLYDFSHGKYTAEFLKEQYRDAEVFLTDATYYTPVIGAMKGKKFYSLSWSKYVAFSFWRPVRSIDLSRIPEKVLRELPPEADYGLYIAMIYDLPQKKSENMFLIYSSIDTQSWIWNKQSNEYYWILLIARPEKAHLFRNKYPLYDPADYVIKR